MFTMISLTKSIHQVFEVLGDRKYLKKKKSFLILSLGGGGKEEILIPTIKNLEVGGEKHPEKIYFQGRQGEREGSGAGGGERGRA